jgi:signal recognition particle GTPase
MGLKPRPSVVPFFVGRQDILDALRSAHVNNSPSQMDTPTISVLAGLGGAGKTQTSLKFALDYEERYVYWIISPCLYLYIS